MLFKNGYTFILLLFKLGSLLLLLLFIAVSNV